MVQDLEMIREGLVVFGQLKDMSDWQPLHGLHSLVVDLVRRAAQEVERMKLELGYASAVDWFSADAADMASPASREAWTLMM
jgi:hypothetical protein